MHPGRRQLGDRGKPQIGADGRRRGDTKDQEEDRRHQRAAADAGQADRQAGHCARHYLCPIHVYLSFSRICSMLTSGASSLLWRWISGFSGAS